MEIKRDMAITYVQAHAGYAEDEIHWAPIYPSNRRDVCAVIRQESVGESLLSSAYLVARSANGIQVQPVVTGISSRLHIDDIVDQDDHVLVRMRRFPRQDVEERKFSKTRLGLD